MDNVKCTCGHANPVGTTICESCGKPLGEEETELLNMRYEGMARRSQLKPFGIVDYIWRFFSSVKYAVWMIALALIASIIGTVLPQDEFYRSNLPPNIFYPETYGLFGKIYYTLGFHQLYSSWWFILLLLMIGVSLVICSIDRVIPLYRALKRQRIPKHLGFYKRQRFFIETPIEESDLDKIKAEIKKRNYKIKENEDGLLAEKGRFSRWGPYINHIGLILLILSIMLRLIPGFYLDTFVWTMEGETKPIPGTQYYIKNEKFTLDVYEEHEFPEQLDLKGGAIVKNFQTDAVLYENVAGELIEVKRGPIVVNHPLKHEGLLIYQNSYQLQQLYALNLSLIHKENETEISSFEVNLFDPQETIQLADGYTVKILEYYPDFDLDENLAPYSKSRSPNLPAFIFKVISPENPDGENSWVISGENTDAITPDNTYTIKLRNLIMNNNSGLAVMIDRGLPVVFFSTFIIMVGLVMGFYWQHRRIWLRVEDGNLYLAAHTNKNWYSLRKELELIMQKSTVNISIDEIDRGGK